MADKEGDAVPENGDNSNQISIYRLYWESYGGFGAILKSRYFWYSVLVSFICFPLFWSCDSSDSSKWFDLPLSVLPNILGFTLGGYAILLAFGDKAFLKLFMKQSKRLKHTLYMELNASIVHFIIIQFIALIYSVISYSWNITYGIIAHVGFFFFIYAIATGMAATFSIFRLSYLYEKTQITLPETDKNTEEDSSHSGSRNSQ